MHVTKLLKGTIQYDFNCMISGKGKIMVAVRSVITRSAWGNGGDEGGMNR